MQRNAKSLFSELSTLLRLGRVSSAKKVYALFRNHFLAMNHISHFDLEPYHFSLHATNESSGQRKYDYLWQETIGKVDHIFQDLKTKMERLSKLSPFSLSLRHRRERKKYKIACAQLTSDLLEAIQSTFTTFLSHIEDLDNTKYLTSTATEPEHVLQEKQFLLSLMPKSPLKSFYIRGRKRRALSAWLKSQASPKNWSRLIDKMKLFPKRFRLTCQLIEKEKIEGHNLQDAFDYLRALAINHFVPAQLFLAQHYMRYLFEEDTPLYSFFHNNALFPASVQDWLPNAYVRGFTHALDLYHYFRERLLFSTPESLESQQKIANLQYAFEESFARDRGKLFLFSPKSRENDEIKYKVANQSFNSLYDSSMIIGRLRPC